MMTNKNSRNITHNSKILVHLTHLMKIYIPNNMPIWCSYPLIIIFRTDCTSHSQPDRNSPHSTSLSPELQLINRFSKKITRKNLKKTLIYSLSKKVKKRHCIPYTPWALHDDFDVMLNREIDSENFRGFFLSKKNSRRFSQSSGTKIWKHLAPLSISSTSGMSMTHQLHRTVVI
jgi:hypothetical protein